MLAITSHKHAGHALFYSRYRHNAVTVALLMQQCQYSAIAAYDDGDDDFILLLTYVHTDMATLLCLFRLIMLYDVI